jgi:hypothetical protein
VAGLAPSLRWQGLRPEIGCDGAEEVAREFARQRQGGFEIDSLELIGSDSHAVMAIHMPEPRNVDGIRFEAIYNVFEIDAGKITRIEDHTERAKALAAAGLG